MSNLLPSLRLTAYAAFILAALVIIMDFIIPGTIVEDEVINVKRERQQYYNAARNYHYSYKVITSEHQFWVAEGFAKLIHKHEIIEFSVSPIFKEVNWSRLKLAENRSYYSLRILSGIALPLLVIISILVTYLYKKKMSTLVFILQALLLADLIFLML